MLTVAELETEIVRDPDDAELRRVYLDALQEAGNPRGEHLALALLADKGDDAAGVKVRAIEDEAMARLTKRLTKDYVVRLHWKAGFVEHVDIDGREPPDKFPRTKLRELLAQPELVALRGLDLRGIWSSDWDVRRMVASLPELCANRPVRWLGIGNGEIDEALIRDLRTAMPGLVGLGVLTTKPTSALRALADLRDIELASNEVGSRKLLDKIYAAASPALERLVVHGMDDKITVENFQPILDREVFPELRHLGVFGPHALTWDLWRALIDCKLTPELASFGFCAAEIWDDDDSEAWLREHGKRLYHVTLFTSAHWPDDDNGHDSGRLGLILKAISRSEDAVPEIEHHLQFSGQDKEHYGCWEELAEAMVWAGRAEEALVPLARGIELFEDSVTDRSIPTYRTQADAFDTLERWDESLQVLTRAIAFEPGNSWSHRTKARALRELGRCPEALVACERAIAVAIDDGSDPQMLGWAHVEHARTLWQMRRIDEALAAYALARELGDETATRSAWWVMGVIENQRGRLRDGLACLEKAVDLVPAEDQESPLYELDGLLYTLGECLYDLAEYQRALDVWRRGARMFSNWKDVDEQGYTLLALGKPAEALAAVEGARADKGGARAAILHALGRTDEAIDAVADYGHRVGLGEPFCAYRHIVGPFIQGALHRAAGREAQARALFAQARRRPDEPRELHAELLREATATTKCIADLCGRTAAVVPIAAAIAVGDHEDAARRAHGLVAIVDAGSARLTPLRMWELRAMLPLLGVDTALVDRTLRIVERCAV